MNAIESVFPATIHMLCSWHINNNILAKCKSGFLEFEDWELFMQDWNKLVSTRTVKSFHETWEFFKVKYSHQKKAVDYINDTWIIHKEKFASPWVDQHMHLGNKTTSRVEGCHAVMKKYIQVSTGNLWTAHGRIIQLNRHQYDEWQAQNAREKIRILHFSKSELYRNVVGKISHFAMKAIKDQENIYLDSRSKNSSSECTQVFTSTMGLPCSHKIANILKMKDVLELFHIHPHWYTERSEGSITSTISAMKIKVQPESIDLALSNLRTSLLSWPEHQQKTALLKVLQLAEQRSMPIFDPVISRPKGRPVGSKNKPKSSTKRDPSAFEIKEEEISGRKCSLCKDSGHNKRSCPQLKHGRFFFRFKGIFS